MSCVGDCNISFFEFIRLCGNEKDLIKWLEDHGVLSRGILCSLCQNPLKLDNGGVFYCGKTVGGSTKKKRCSYRASMKKGTWFSGSKLTIPQICMLTASWACLRPPRQQFLVNEMKLATGTIVDWASYCREVCVKWCVTKREKIGGPGIIVDFDEARIDHRKYKPGHKIDVKWVLGGIERDSKKLFIVGVPDKSKDILLAVIKEWILPGTTIMSNCLQRFDYLKDKGFLRLTADHSVKFVDAATADHNKSVEQVWREVRSNVPRCGRKNSHYEGYLAEFLWKRAFPNHTRRLHALFDTIGKMYEPGTEYVGIDVGDGDGAPPAKCVKLATPV